MKNIAVICALPPERNTGMATVDLSAFSNLPRLLPDAKITLYTYGATSQYAYQKGELPFDHVDLLANPEAYLNSDVFIFWGDFIHSHSYWKLDRGSWDKSLDALSVEERKKVQADKYADYSKYVFLAGQDKRKLASSIVFGSTIITNEAQDMLDAAYAANYNGLMENAGAVLFRDALSAAKVSPLRKREATLACDCALLLRDDQLAQLGDFSRANTRKGVGVFFGRSSSKMQMLNFARQVAAEAGEELRWVPWFPTLRRLRLPAKLLGYNIPEGHKSVGALLSELTACRFVITDTYHMCVNAWRLGIPAICIGDGAADQNSSLADKKKEIFYEMYGARRLYAFTEQLGLLGRNKKLAASLVKHVQDEQLCSTIHQTIIQHARVAEMRLAAALKNVLEPSA